MSEEEFLWAGVKLELVILIVFHFWMECITASEDSKSHYEFLEDKNSTFEILPNRFQVSQHICYRCKVSSPHRELAWIVCSFIFVFFGEGGWFWFKGSWIKVPLSHILKLSAPWVNRGESSSVWAEPSCSGAEGTRSLVVKSSPGEWSQHNGSCVLRLWRSTAGQSFGMLPMWRGRTLTSQYVWSRQFWSGSPWGSFGYVLHGTSCLYAKDPK